MKLKKIVMLSLVAGAIVACNNTGGVVTPSVVPLSGAHVEADVNAAGKIIEVREYALVGGAAKINFTFNPHGRHAKLSSRSKTTYYFKSHADYQSARGSLDSSLSSAALPSTNKNLSSGVSGATPEAFYYGLDIGHHSGADYVVSGSGGYLSQNPDSPRSGPWEPMCFYYSAAASSPGNNQSAFVSTSGMTSANNSGSNANTFSDDLDIGASFGAFSAKNNAAYSNNYLGDYQNGSFSYISTFVMPNVELTYTGLSNYAYQLLATGGQDKFNEVCGSSYTSSVPLGLTFNINFQFTSDSSQSLMSFTDNLTANYSTIASLSNALSSSSSSSDSSLTEAFSSELNGDYIFQNPHSSIAGVEITAGTSISDVIATLALVNGYNVANSCVNAIAGAAPASAACSTALTNLSSAQAILFSYMQTELSSNQLLPANLGMFDRFSHGVTLPVDSTTHAASAGGTSNTETFLSYASMSTLPNIQESMNAAIANASIPPVVSDPYLNSSQNLKNYTSVLWQLNALILKAQNSSNYLLKSSPTLTTATLPMDAAFTNLANSYLTDYTAITNALSGCLNLLSESPSVSVATQSTACAGIPQMTAQTAYDLYNTPGQLQAFVPSPTLVQDKLINSILLQYSTQYLETAQLASPGNTWVPDAFYTGSPSPLVQNSVNMSTVYVTTSNTVGSGGSKLLPGIASAATGGVTMNNPFCPAGGGACDFEINTPINGTKSWMLPNTPFFYSIPAVSSGTGDFFTPTFTASAGQDLSSYFLMPMKFIGANAEVGFDVVWPWAGDYNGNLSLYEQGTAYFSSGKPLAGTAVQFTPAAGGVVPQFEITSRGASSTEHGDLAANGVFGPVVSWNQYLYNIIQYYNPNSPTMGSGSATGPAATINSIMSNWLMTVPNNDMAVELAGLTGCYSDTGAYANFDGCDGSGLYPYRDSGFIDHANFVGALSTKVLSTSNTLQFVPIANFFK